MRETSSTVDEGIIDVICAQNVFDRFMFTGIFRSVSDESRRARVGGLWSSVVLWNHGLATDIIEEGKLLNLSLSEEHLLLD